MGSTVKGFKWVRQEWTALGFKDFDKDIFGRRVVEKTHLFNNGENYPTRETPQISAKKLCAKSFIMYGAKS